MIDSEIICDVYKHQCSLNNYCSLYSYEGCLNCFYHAVRVYREVNAYFYQHFEKFMDDKDLIRGYNYNYKDDLNYCVIFFSDYIIADIVAKFIENYFKIIDANISYEYYLELI